MNESSTCPACGEAGELDLLPVEDGFDAGERLCLRCGLALWVPTPAPTSARPRLAASTRAG
jgi:hypothetical protein